MSMIIPEFQADPKYSTSSRAKPEWFRAERYDYCDFETPEGRKKNPDRRSARFFRKNK